MRLRYNRGMRKLPSLLFSLILIFPIIASFVTPAKAQVLGIHLLNPSELSSAEKLLSTKDGAIHYVTVPFTFDDMNYKSRWEAFFREARNANLRPLLRLTTRFENGAWVVPTRADVMRVSAFLTSIEWHADDLTVILWNEPNHANEWGGKIDPTSYAEVADFAVDWFKTESKNYVVLPAGIDLAAPNSSDTMEAFEFWKQVFNAAPDLLEKFDGWTSHSYPNPGFSSDPWKTDKMSLRGYQHELIFLSQFSKKQFPVYITETGWNHNSLSAWEVQNYYQIAFKNIWNSDPRIKAVTPFLLQGAPGTFAPFSFLDAFGNPTKAYAAYQDILGNN